MRGRFNEFAGTIEFDESNPDNSRVDVTIQAGSIDTAEPDRDKHLRSADFFDVENYPTLRFVSTSVTPRGGNDYDVKGDLTIHGVTRQVVLPATFVGAATDPWGNQKSVFEAELPLNRKDFGLTWNAALETGGFLVGDEVTSVALNSGQIILEPAFVDWRIGRLLECFQTVEGRFGE